MDQAEYSPGETATFSCGCSLPNEELQSGYIVIQYNNGTVIFAFPTTSGLCRTSLFGGPYVIPAGSSGVYNVTFAAAADGTGTPINWGNVGDIITDWFNVTGATITQCLISNFTGSPSLALGTLGSIGFKLTDQTTGLPIIHASCLAIGYDIDGAPLVHEPEGGHTWRMSLPEGQVTFQHKMDESFWMTNTTYVYRFYCYSLPDNNMSDIEHVGWLSDGTLAGFKQCSASALFTTGGADYRPSTNPKDTSSFYFILLITLAAVVILGFSIKEVWFVVIGGLGFIILGVYTLNNGIVGFKDMFVTYSMALFEIAVGTILSVGAAIQKMDFD